ncbi:MAG TPA: twin-arginine translocase TatA/TatE family subunit [Actinomycetota bacterium]|nr:twin-arginine translocase TatA/TatE family subunit [Actinomycetota bacterium]
MNFGPVKLLFTAIAALLILGPKRIPGAVRSVGKAVSQLRQASRQVTEELKSEFEAAEPDEPPVRPALRAAPPPNPGPGAGAATATTAPTADDEEERRPGPRP